MASKFEFEVQRHFLPSDLCQFIFAYARLRYDTNSLLPPDDRIPTAGRLYCDPVTETLLANKHRDVEEIVGVEMFPSYSYLRVHTRGASMPAHTDREASEVGVTIAIGGDTAWPLWLRPADGPVAVTLSPGDAVVYHGREIPHWREQFNGDVQVQCMLFYVRAHGDYADWKFDRRQGIGFPQVQTVNTARKEVHA